MHAARLTSRKRSGPQPRLNLCMNVRIFLLACLFSAAALAESPDAGRAAASRATPAPAQTRFIAGQSVSVVEIFTLEISGRVDPWNRKPDWPQDKFAGRAASAQAVRPVLDPARDIASGVIVASDGFILTSAHVVADIDEAHVRLADGRRFAARIVGLDKDTDVGLLKIEATGLPVAVIGDSSLLAAGDWVFAIGSPFGFHGSITAGIVSARDRIVPDAGKVPFIQTDVATNPGSSGGPLFNLAGEVVGLSSVIYSGSGGYMGVSFAVPINLAMEVAAQLRKEGKVTRAHLGLEVQELSPALAEAFRLPKPAGVLVLRIESGGPAQVGGLAAGDILLALDDRDIAGVADLMGRLSRLLPGTRSQLAVWRRGAMLSVPLTLAARSSSPPLAAPAAAPEWRHGLGLELTEPTAAHLRQLRADNGLLVQEAVGAARSEGILSGDVIVALNDEPVGNLAQFQRLLARAAPASTVALLVLRDGNLSYVPIRLPQRVPR